MSHKNRYFLLFLGSVIFIILAPLAIMYATGGVFDFKQFKIIKTGVIYSDSQPNWARVEIDGKASGNTPLQKNFHRPGMANIKISKQGYFTWEKKLEITPEQVTKTGQITLLFNPPETIFFYDQILDFKPSNNKIIALAKDRLLIINGKILEKEFIFKEAEYENFSLSPSAETALVFGKNAKNALQISLIDGTQKKINLQLKFEYNPIILNDGAIYWLEKNALKIFQNASVKIFQQNVFASAIVNNNIFFLQTEGNVSRIFQLNLFNLSLQKNAETEKTFFAPSLLVNEKNQFFILDSGAIFDFGQQLEIVNSGVEFAGFDELGDNLIILTPGQAQYYNTQTAKLKLAYRGSQIISNASLFEKDGQGYIFAGISNKLLAIELDMRDHQNSYEFGKFEKIKKIQVSQGGKNLNILNNNALTILKIR